MKTLRFELALAALTFAGAASGAVTGAVIVDVDAREAPRGIQRAHLTFPVEAGPLTLEYPKWVPGDHSPTGPISSLSDLRVSAGGRDLPWRRDPVDMYAFHVEVPQGIRVLDVTLEFVGVSSGSGHTGERASSEFVAMLNLGQVLLYPLGTKSDELRYRASVRLPADWRFATALPVASRSGDTTRFDETSLTTLIDSPLLAGLRLKSIPLGGQPPVTLEVAADSEAALQISPASVQQFQELVQQAQRLFGSSHFRQYHFLWALSDQMGASGQEHHESSDNRSPERVLVDETVRRSVGSLLPHEFVHSWNGKFRRPSGLATPNYDVPMEGELLWVYEGLTEYLGEVLAARSGLKSMSEVRDTFANTAGEMTLHRGRSWRSLQDTARSAQILYYEPNLWVSRLRTTDFYRESTLLWLEADVLIRKLSHDRKSLDDFCKAFFGGPASAPQVVPYDFDQLLATLSAIQPYDWRGFWTERLNRTAEEAPLEGLQASGWRVVYRPEPNVMAKAGQSKGGFAAGHFLDLRHSLGFLLRGADNEISDVVPGSAADQAGLAPGSRLFALNGRHWSEDIVRDQLKASVEGARTFSLLVEKDEVFRNYDLHYSGGERFPALERDPGKPDVFSQIMTPLRFQGVE